MSKSTTDLYKMERPRLFSSPTTVNHYTIRLNDDIIEPSAYNEDFMALDSMGPDDACIIMINSGGGHLDTAVEFVNTIEGCEGHIHAHINGTCCSAATMIALKCHSFSVGNHVNFMIHAPSGGFMGRFNEAHSQSNFYERWTKEFYTDVYLGFLTEDEIEQVLSGKTFWFNSEETQERLTKFTEYKNSLLEDEVDDEDFDNDNGNGESCCGSCNDCDSNRWEAVEVSFDDDSLRHNLEFIEHDPDVEFILDDVAPKEYVLIKTRSGAFKVNVYSTIEFTTGVAGYRIIGEKGGSK